LESVSTEEGMEIEKSERLCVNAPDRMEERRDPGSNITVERDQHRQKQRRPIEQTEAGIQIDASK
jgi:hypothetical protein